MGSYAKPWTAAAIVRLAEQVNYNLEHNTTTVKPALLQSKILLLGTGEIFARRTIRAPDRSVPDADQQNNDG